ncbi:hypothetical protein [Methylorubrum sp. SB2]|uniref:hypothetical protein n=1 Tax=Methylorubrum subtropicum TaxID=3138812 RepID=UPI00313F28C6
MSLFTDDVAKIERSLLKERAGTLPPIEISRRFEKAYYYGRGIWIGIGGFAVAALWLCQSTIPDVFGWKACTLASLAVVFGLTLYLRRVRSVLIHEAALERIKAGEAKAARLAAEAANRAAEEERQAAVAAEAARQRSLAIAQAERQKLLAASEQAKQQAIADAFADRHKRMAVELRTNALRTLENSIIRVLEHLRERAEFVPESVGEEHIYELIRKPLRASRAPELGLLRRTVQAEVMMVIGPDQSWLPPEPTDEQLMRGPQPSIERIITISG